MFSTRRMVAALGAIHASKTVAARAPRRPSGVPMGASYPLSIAAKERAPASTAEQAVSSTFTSEAWRAHAAGRPESAAAGSAA